MAIGAFDSDAFDTGAFDSNAFLFTDTGVIVPDVVGNAQAAGTATLEGAGFVVSVATAYSSVVPAGTIISQSPAAGTEVGPGSIIIITVSLGDAPVTDAQPSGGWEFYEAFDRERRRRKKKLQELDEQEEAEKLIKEARDAEIARFMHEQERLEYERDRLARLKELALRYSAQEATSERVKTALVAAQQAQTFATLERLEREIERQLQEEEFLLMLLLSD